MAPVVTPTSANLTASKGQSFVASSLFTASDADGDTLTQYDFWDTGGGGGHFLVNGVTQPANQDIHFTASQLVQTTYQSGSGADTLWVRAYDGTLWSAWSASFTVTASGGTTAMTAPSDHGAGARNAAASASDWSSVKGDGETDWRLVVN